MISEVIKRGRESHKRARASSVCRPRPAKVEMPPHHAGHGGDSAGEDRGHFGVEVASGWSRHA